MARFSNLGNILLGAMQPPLLLYRLTWTSIQDPSTSVFQVINKFDDEKASQAFQSLREKKKEKRKKKKEKTCMDSVSFQLGVPQRNFINTTGLRPKFMGNRHNTPHIRGRSVGNKSETGWSMWTLLLLGVTPDFDIRRMARDSAFVLYPRQPFSVFDNKRWSAKRMVFRKFGVFYAWLYIQSQSLRHEDHRKIDCRPIVALSPTMSPTWMPCCTFHSQPIFMSQCT